MAFVNFNRIQDLNKNEAERMGQNALAGSEGAFNQADEAISAAGADQKFAGGDPASAVNTAAAKAKALRSLGGIAANQSYTGRSVGGSAFDAALAGGSQTMGNAYARMGDYQQRYKNAQTQGLQVRDERARMAAQTEADRQARAAAEAEAKRRALQELQDTKQEVKDDEIERKKGKRDPYEDELDYPDRRDRGVY